MPLLPPLGAHVATPRRGYVHHGIHVGGGRVVHYAGFARSLRRGPVEEVSLETFAGRNGYAVMDHANAAYGNSDIAERARSRLGESRYHLLRNNCEHLAHWCITGRAVSRQADALLAPLVRMRALLSQLTSRGWRRGRLA